ncbi:translation machinery associated TMA7-domain-containing protein [Irpex rosettiformis]|uniref:Translation machinery associated TMA7-domain-containing protein n=1 Tax=Irpex rosettiformis TaxID=378272 RepID=A0ACB8TTT4_9APHY|nr:translation machinery associated TMA7-domain-containing protein [Irpex rosettiformis]
MSRQGGKLKPLKAPKKDKKEEDEEDVAFKKRKQEEAAALKAAKDKALKGVYWCFPSDGRAKLSVRLQEELLVAVSRNLARNRQTNAITLYNTTCIAIDHACPPIRQFSRESRLRI